MKSGVQLSYMATEAITLLAKAIRVARIDKRMTLDELAARVGVGTSTVKRIERGDPIVNIGAYIEAAVITGVPLFDPDPDVRARHGARLDAELRLLPRRVHTERGNDDAF